MDDSDQDFVDLCSKPLKRVHKKAAEPRQPRKAEHQPPSQAGEGEDQSRSNYKKGDSGTHPVSARSEQHAVSGVTGHDSGDDGSSAVPSAARPRAKDSVLGRMQQFKRASPRKMVHQDKSLPANDCVPLQQPQIQAESFSSGLHPELQDSDEALALQLQQELDREAAEAQMVDLEDGGLFFCQICHKDLSHMTPEGRTQHLNRCLDQSEERTPAPPPPAAPPPPPGVPDCPICGKKFKSQKSRSAHLKRCSTDMGISPAVLLQALQRQAEETQNVPAANTLSQTGGTKRKDPSKPGLPATKKPRKQTDRLDEDTMVALALSSSLQEQDRKAERRLQTEGATCHTSITPVLKWRPDTGAVKGHGKKKKGAIPRPLPLLLVQDAQTALTRLQERVSALLLHSRAPSPPTPILCPSSLPGWSGAAPLWQKSALLDGDSTCLSDFYTPELRDFITPWESAVTDAAFSNTSNKPESSVQPVSEGSPVTKTRTSILPSSSQTAAASCSPALPTPETKQLPVGSQALRDLMELAEDGMTLTQCGFSASGPDKDKQSSASLSANLHLSGFVLEEAEEHDDLWVSGFLPEPTHPHSKDTNSQARRETGQPGADKEQVALPRLASDLSTMVNNPQLSDVELQVDSGDVYFAHSFMVYTRCPLLTEMVHESGFGVQEDNMPAARRVLMNDVPGPAVLALLQYLYTARCSIPPSLLPHVLELASRFDLQELRQLCVLQQEAAADEHEENFNNQTDEAFMELLCSMWNEEDEETDNDGGRDEERALKEDQHGNDLVSGDREMHDEKVNEEELEAIYEFAATQRKRKEEKDSGEEEEEWKVDEGEDREDLLSKLTEPKRGFNEKSLTVQSQLELDSNLRLSDPWRVDEEADPSSLPSASGPSKTHSPRSQQQQSSPKPSSELSGRTLLQSSASVVDDFSLRSPLSTSNLPIPGLSPGLVGDWGGGGDERTDKLDVPLKRESQGPNGICVSLSPDSPQNKKETEVIVLSDSSEEMEIVLSSRSPSPHSPCAVQCLKSCTQIKPQQPTSENKDCSPEVSWLIPSTPVQPGSSSRSSSTQTKNSMCRMQLFPKSGVSLPSSVFSSPELSGNRPQTSTTPVQPGSSSRSSSTQTKNSMCRMQLFPKSEVSLPSSVFSSPELSGNRPQTSTSPTRVSAPAGPTEGSVSMVKLDRLVPCGSSLDLSLSPKRTSSYNASKAREVLALSKPKLSSTANSHPLQESSKQDTPLHLQLYSSTPLHTELHHPPFHLAASPLDTDLDKKKSTGGGKERKLSESSEKTELGNFHLSPLSDPSDPPSSFSHRGLQSLQRHSESRCSVESSRCDNTGTELKRGAEVESVGVRNETADLGDEGEQTDVADSSFRQSFIDEPPIAFSDSWGLDAHVEANPGCFSLRLEDSGGSNQQEHILGERTARLSPSTDCRPPPSSICNQSSNCHGSVINSSPAKAQSAQPPACVQVHAHSSFTPSPPGPTTCTPPDINNILMDTKIWDSWEEEEEEEEALPLFQRVNPSARLKTPMSSHKKNRQSLVPITPMPHYSDMDTPELKNKLNRFGVRPLPKRQMILKLKEIHQYTHQLVSSDSEDEAPSAGQAARTKPPPARSVAAGSRPVSCTQTVNFKKPSAPVAVSGEEGELLSASKGSDTSSTAASEESERSNSELCLSSDGDSDSNGGISASQAADRLKDRLQAVRSFILSDSGLYTQILQYQPLVLSQLQERLKAAGIRLGAAKLVDYLDSQCITFTTAKPGHSAPSRRWGKRKGKGAKAAGEKGKSRKKDIAAMI